MMLRELLWESGSSFRTFGSGPGWSSLAISKQKAPWITWMIVSLSRLRLTGSPGSRVILHTISGNRWQKACQRRTMNSGCWWFAKSISGWTVTLFVICPGMSGRIQSRECFCWHLMQMRMWTDAACGLYRSMCRKIWAGMHMAGCTLMQTTWSCRHFIWTTLSMSNRLMNWTR